MAIRDGLSAYWNFNDDGSGGVSLADSTGNGYTLTNVGGVTLGTGVVGGCAVFGEGQNFTFSTDAGLDFGTGNFSVSMWVKTSPTQSSGSNIFGVNGDGGYSDGCIATWVNGTALAPDNVRIIQYTNSDLASTSGSVPSDTWTNIAYVRSSGVLSIFINGTLNNSGTFEAPMNFNLNGTAFIGGGDWDGTNGQYYGSLDEMGVWNRALTPEEITTLYTNPAELSSLYYNNAQEDGDWGNLLNWWQDSGFTVQATALPNSTTAVNLYNQVAQNSQGASHCYCFTAAFHGSASFGAGLILQGNAIFNDSSSNAGYINGNAVVNYSGGDAYFPIGGYVDGSVSYLGWPAVTPQWFNDTVSLGGAGDGDFSDTANWWTDNTFTTRPINSVGTQTLPDASTNIFIVPNGAIYSNTGTLNPTVNTLTADSAELAYIGLTVTNGATFSGDSWGMYESTIYGDVTFRSGAYNEHSVIHGHATYTSPTSLVYSFNVNSLQKITQGGQYGSNNLTVTIAGSVGGQDGLISRLLRFPWFLNF